HGARSRELQLASLGPRGGHGLPRRSRCSRDPAGLLRLRIRRPFDRRSRGQRLSVESDLAVIDADSLRSASGTGSSTLGSANALASHLRDTRRGRELWMTFLLLAAAALAGELLLGSARALRA